MPHLGSADLIGVPEDVLHPIGSADLTGGG